MVIKLMEAETRLEAALHSSTLDKNSLSDESNWPIDGQGNRLVQISCGAAELVPTRQYANITVGPIGIKRFVTDGDDDHLLKEIEKTQKLCEMAVSSDRETVHNAIRQSEQGRLIP